jgi:hypothetical protein
MGDRLPADRRLGRAGRIGPEILEVQAEAGLAAPLPARGPSLLASRPAPRAALADPGQAR